MYDAVTGDFLVVGLGEEDFASLTPELAQKYEQHFHLPVLIPQGTVQGQSHELALVIADDGHRVCKGVNSINRAAHKAVCPDCPAGS